MTPYSGYIIGTYKLPRISGSIISNSYQSNIDRILALYQALHPDQYVPERDLHKPLKPFYKDAGDKDFWTSVEAKDWKQCGFAVPGTKDIDPDQLRHYVEEYINKNYFWMAGREAPPANLGFPKSMDSVEALIGGGSKPWNQQISIKAVNAQSSSLVTRTISVANGASTISEDPAVSEHDITSRDKTAFPKFALNGNRQRTWNIHLKVRK